MAFRSLVLVLALAVGTCAVPIVKWSEEEVHQFLTNIGFDAAGRIASEHRVDGKTLLSLSESEIMEEFGLGKLRARRVVTELRHIGDGESQPAPGAAQAHRIPEQKHQSTPVPPKKPDRPKSHRTLLREQVCAKKIPAHCAGSTKCCYDSREKLCRPAGNRQCDQFRPRQGHDEL
mmetsp:Transcript_19873/g.22174  ORF Transcript_19873/g.22174 Transcript_19873/m.22174 type:complete len:175 (+) Transcript_19873:69-593(+)|eukprot:CAMPEP_0205829090 /NCGR_PEP_ID=MMETSP0206-20130828/37051_1 /ASSEMBLY_ACC=CAM_ASM_000279 /TAXON_ID=36767 /ORGANISM="Euplotes focardii, Strain TN1" /LENGTH=174 /DNA_ID=CAMNT_0053131509 /DNA_START=69 /DNA_END=593 /DNA_ORIENTATION=+